MKKIIAIAILLILFGIGAGYYLATAGNETAGATGFEPPAEAADTTAAEGGTESGG